MANFLRRGSAGPLAFLALCVCSGSDAGASSVSWTGNASNAFDVAGNWSGTHTPPQSDDSLVFAAAGAGTLNNNLTSSAFNVAGITFNAGAGAFVIGGNAFTLTGDVANNSTSLQTISAPFSVTGPRTFTTTAGGGNITLGGNIDGAGGLTKFDAGTFTLGGNNSYIGGTTVRQGTLVLNSNTAAGGYAAGAIVLGDGSTGSGNIAVNFGSGIGGNDIALRGTSARRVNAVTVANTESSGTVTLGFTGATPMLYSDLTINRAVVIASNNATRLQRSWMGQITGPGAGAGNDSIVVDSGSGNWMTIFAKDTGTASVANTFEGNLRVKSGNLEIGGLTYIADTAANENLTIPATAAVTVDTGATLMFVWGSQTFDALNGGGTIARNTADNQGTKTLTIGASGGSGDFSGTIDSAFHITKTGSGTQIFSGNNTYTGLTTIAEGTLRISGNIANTGGTLISPGGTLELGAGGTSGSLPYGVINHGTFVFNRADLYTFAGSISGDGVVRLDGNSVFLTGPQSYTGPTQINSGTLVLPTASSYGLSASTVVTIAAGGAALDLSNRAQKIAGLEGAGVVISSGGSSGNLTLEVSAGQSHTFSGVLGGYDDTTFAVIKTGPGTQILLGQTYHAGGVFVTDGILQLGDGIQAASLRGGAGGNGASHVGISAIGEDGGSGEIAFDVDGGMLLVSPQANIFGGLGGNGGAGADDPTTLGPDGGYGGDGGTGGAAVHLSMAGSMVNNGVLTGGNGGDAGPGFGGEGDGGYGGPGVLFSADGPLTNSGSIYGGRGGIGGRYSDGGGGGAGIHFSASASAINSGSVTGGAGNAGDYGGNGGAGILFSAGGSLINSGSVSGGAGNTGDYRSGSGGAGIVFSAGGSLINGGTISGGSGAVVGGFGYSPGSPGMGVTYSGGPGTLTNQSGGVINGGVGMDAFANSVTLETGSLVNGDLTIGPSTSSTLTLTGSGTQAWSGAVTGATTFAGSLTKAGTGTWTLDQAFDYTGATTVTTGTLVVDASIAASSGVSVSAGAKLTGHGVVSGISGAGLVAPSGPQILTATGIDPGSGLDFTFHFTQPGAPDYATSAGSGNGLLHLTGATPVTLSLTAANTITIDFSGAPLADGQIYYGGFFTDTAAADSLLSGAGFAYTGLGGFTAQYAGLVVQPSANFTTGTVANGSVMSFHIVAVPEPDTAAAGLLGLALLLARRKRS